MLRFLIGSATRMLLLAAALYGVFFVPVGGHSLYRHAARIAATPEAQELGRALAHEATDLVARAVDVVHAGNAQAQATGD